MRHQIVRLLQVQDGLDLLHAVVADEVHRPHAALAADENVRVLALHVGLDRARAQAGRIGAARNSVRPEAARGWRASSWEIADI